MMRCVGINKCKKEYLETSKAYCSGTSWMRSNTVLLKGQKKKRKNKKKRRKRKKKGRRARTTLPSPGQFFQKPDFHVQMDVGHTVERRANEPPLPFQQASKEAAKEKPDPSQPIVTGLATPPHLSRSNLFG